jgi:hypothetical protein
MSGFLCSILLVRGFLRKKKSDCSTVLTGNVRAESRLVTQPRFVFFPSALSLNLRVMGRCLSARASTRPVGTTG